MHCGLCDDIIVLYAVQTVGESGQRLVIVNLQNTPLDHLTKLRVYAKCDDFTKLVMSKLGLEIPEFKLKRYLSDS